MSDDGFPYPVDVPGNFSNAGMPLGDAQDPPVDLMALEAARDIWATVPELLERSKAQAVSRIQLRVESAIKAALDRHEALVCRRTR